MIRQSQDMGLRRPRGAGWATMTKRAREKEPIPGSLGAVIRQLRKDRNWSQEDLAEAAGIDQNDVSRVETGKSRKPQEQTLLGIAEALGLSLGKMYEMTDYPELSYQIPPLRQELKTLGVDEQTMVLHLTRFYLRNKENFAELDSDELTAWFQAALLNVDIRNTRCRESAPSDSGT